MARAPPDSFYVIRVYGRRKIQVLKITSRYRALNLKTKVAFEEVLKASGREGKRRSDAFTYYGFKAPQDASRIYENTGHERGNDWIKLENLGIYRAFEALNGKLSDLEILQMLDKASDLVNFYTIKRPSGKDESPERRNLSFNVVFDASEVNTDDIWVVEDHSIAGALMPILEQLNEARESILREGFDGHGGIEFRTADVGKRSPEVKSYELNRNNWEMILAENEAARLARAQRAKRELEEADKRLWESFRFILAKYSIPETAEAPEELMDAPFSQVSKRNLMDVLERLKETGRDAGLAKKIMAIVGSEPKKESEDLSALRLNSYYRGYGFENTASVIGGGRPSA